MIAPPASARPLPQGFQRGSITVMGLELNMVSHASGKPPLVFLHGLGGSCEDWYDTMPRLAADFDCLAFDWPGYGWSPKLDLPYGVDFFCGVLDEALDRLGLAKADVIGHSMGGQTVLKFAITRPDKVSRLAAVCPAGGHTQATTPQKMALLLLADGDRLRFAPRSVMRLLATLPFAERSAPAVRAFAERFVAQWFDLDRPWREAALLRSGRSILATPVWRETGRIAAPALVVTAHHDILTPSADTQRLVDGIPGARHIVIGRDHMLPYSQPNELATALRGFFGAGS